MSVTAPQYKNVIHIALVTQYEGENKLLIMEMNYFWKRVKSSRMFSIRNYERRGMGEKERIT
jgi:surface antigen